MEPRTAAALRDIGETLDRAEGIVRRGRAAYDADDALRLAGEALISRIGEGVSRLPDDVKHRYPDVPWTAIRAMRIVIAHHYEAVDYAVIWDTLAISFPELRASLADVLPER